MTEDKAVTKYKNKISLDQELTPQKSYANFTSINNFQWLNDIASPKMEGEFCWLFFHCTYRFSFGSIELRCEHTHYAINLQIVVNVLRHPKKWKKKSFDDQHVTLTSAVPPHSLGVAHWVIYWVELEMEAYSGAIKILLGKTSWNKIDGDSWRNPLCTHFFKTLGRDLVGWKIGKVESLSLCMVSRSLQGFAGWI